VGKGVFYEGPVGGDAAVAGVCEATGGVERGGAAGV